MSVLPTGMHCLHWLSRQIELYGNSILFALLNRFK